MCDFDNVADFAEGWDGFFRVSDTSSAYSSLDLQADNRVGFFYEETLTGFGKRDNPISTSFPTGAGKHNFDGFDNIYVAYTLEQITNGAYSVKRDVDRRAFLQDYFYAVADSLPEVENVAVKRAAKRLHKNPTTKQIDRIYSLMK